MTELCRPEILEVLSFISDEVGAYYSVEDCEDMMKIYVEYVSKNEYNNDGLPTDGLVSLADEIYRNKDGVKLVFYYD